MIDERVRAAGEVVGKAPEAVLEQLRMVAGELRDPTLFTDAEARTFGMRVDFPDDEWVARRASTLEHAISGSKALAQVAVARRGTIRAERGIGAEGRPAIGMAGVFTSVIITGPGSLDDDLVVARAIGFSTVIDAVAARLRHLEPDVLVVPRQLRTIVYSAGAGEDTELELGVRATIETFDRIVRNATELGLSPADLAWLDALYPQPLSGAPLWVRVGATLAEPRRGLTLVFGAQSTGSAIELVRQLAPTAEAKFERWFDATGAPGIRTIELSLGGPKPIAWIGADVRA
jgi:hypothetical protein